jgi:DNA-binding transcriptional LysR family regulator
LEKAGLKWRLAYSSPSYAGKMAAVKAGLGLTVIQRTLIPHNLDQINIPCLPTLNPIHMSLLKKDSRNKAIESLEYFLLRKLKH